MYKDKASSVELVISCLYWLHVSPENLTPQLVLPGPLLPADIRSDIYVSIDLANIRMALHI